MSEILKIFILLVVSNSAFGQVWVGGAGVCHVEGNPNQVNILEQQDTLSDCLFAYDIVSKGIYTYHFDSLLGARWILLAGVNYQPDTVQILVTNGTDSAYIKSSIAFQSSQTLVQQSISGSDGEVLVITNLNFDNIDPTETNKLASRLMEEPIAKTKLRDSLFVTLYYKVENHTGSYIDLPFDLPISDTDINAKFTYIRDGFKSIYQTYFTISNDINGNRRRVNFLIPAQGENFIFKLHP